MPDLDKMVQMGALGAPHGIKGEIAINWHGENAVPTSQPLYLRAPDGSFISHAVLGARRHKGRWILLFDGINDRDEAAKLTGAPIYIPRDALPAPAPDEAYLNDLIGCAVLLPNGVRVGVLDHLEFPAGREVWAILDDSEREILFPARPEFIKSFELGKRAVIIDPPEGLLDIYRA